MTLSFFVLRLHHEIRLYAIWLTKWEYSLIKSTIAWYIYSLLLILSISVCHNSCNSFAIHPTHPGLRTGRHKSLPCLGCDLVHPKRWRALKFDPSKLRKGRRMGRDTAWSMWHVCGARMCGRNTPLKPGIIISPLPNEVIHKCTRALDHDRFKWWLITYAASIHYPNQCWPNLLLTKLLIDLVAWWRQGMMDTRSTLLTLCVGNPGMLEKSQHRRPWSDAERGCFCC